MLHLHFPTLASLRDPELQHFVSALPPQPRRTIRLHLPARTTSVQLQALLHTVYSLAPPYPASLDLLPSSHHSGVTPAQYDWTAVDPPAALQKLEHGLTEPKYAVTALGGTFDHLHSGHKILLSVSVWLTYRRLIVGISDVVLLRNKKYANQLESLETRQRAVREFVDQLEPTLQIDTPPLQDVYGPTAWDPEVQAIVVSEETRAGGQAVNELRRGKGLSELDIYVIPLVSATQGVDPTDAKMGSTEIRRAIEEGELTA